MDWDFCMVREHGSATTTRAMKNSLFSCSGSQGILGQVSVIDFLCFKTGTDLITPAPFSSSLSLCHSPASFKLPIPDCHMTVRGISISF